MMTIVKGLLTLPIVLIVIGAIWVMGTMLMTFLAFVAAALCIVIPFLLKLACVAFVIIAILWALGTVVNQIL